ncbi:histidinol dehydrogenase [Dehalogenimonas lykanthroporepellens BL-DC-9]|jgi:histidinol dehydrogenase|nr:histidinol dehydrogenase [Dehalogenimonas lykanthroporepellens BL-DC-9]
MKVIFGFEQGRRALDRTGSLPSVDANLEAVVSKIVESVRINGDNALKALTREYDGVQLESFEVAKPEIEAAKSCVDIELLRALDYAANRILDYHQIQKTNIDSYFSLMKGRQLSRPLERVGLYAPGGKAYYPSTVLMTALPAKAAGAGTIYLATPPGPEGKIPAPTLAAAAIAGVDGVFSIGGAQAIAAFAYGTQCIPRVDKICGPGNKFVMTAKKLVFGDVAIDGLQGPSEVLIIADSNSNPRYCATDMLAQAEHDPDATSVLVTTSEKLARNVLGEIKEIGNSNSRHDIIVQSLNAKGKIIIVDNIDEAIELSNIYAPEHLCLLSEQASARLADFKHAGCVFTGPSATVAIGDYVAGPSHALPTSGTARFSSPLNVWDFLKIIDVVDVDNELIQQSGHVAVTIAEAEGLSAHALAIKSRM